MQLWVLMYTDILPTIHMHIPPYMKTYIWPYNVLIWSVDAYDNAYDNAVCGKQLRIFKVLWKYSIQQLVLECVSYCPEVIHALGNILRYNVVWPFWSVADPVCGRFGLWPFRLVAVSFCGRFGLWPFRLWPFRFFGRFGCGRFGLWPLWPVTIHHCPYQWPPLQTRITFNLSIDMKLFSSQSVRMEKKFHPTLYNGSGHSIYSRKDLSQLILRKRMSIGCMIGSNGFNRFIHVLITINLCQ